MVEEVKKGICTSCTFNKTGWKNIRTTFNNKIGFQYTQVQLRNKHNKLRIQYGSFKKLLGQSGFDNNEWTKFKKDGFPIYLELCIIFGGTYATGEQAIGTGQNLPLSDDDNCEDDDNDFLEGFGYHHLDEEGFTPANPSTPVHDKHNLDRTPNTKRRKKSSQYNLIMTRKAIEDMIKSSPATSQPPVNPYSVAAVVTILLNILELDDGLYTKGVDKACASAEWREAFIISTFERRNALLRNL
ncbi:uncharacterized protein LOC125316275 [Rhodamnia argentea]|uniref:Uncharacterized protein LOC125316275 n=1 Tax=Rhodamnia argentea TaxID=178133 RepID=A0ABM3HUH8_9MYRT|nr:uncharacterized protein LOC125316275 [Rhodamnia argentea]